MTEQTELCFDYRTRARRSDPATSFDAAERMEKSGTASRQIRLVYGYLCDIQEGTAREIANTYGADYYVVSRRLSELEANGLAERVIDINGKQIRRGDNGLWRAKTN